MFQLFSDRQTDRITFLTSFDPVFTPNVLFVTLLQVKGSLKSATGDYQDN